VSSFFFGKPLDWMPRSNGTHAEPEILSVEVFDDKANPVAEASVDLELDNNVVASKKSDGLGRADFPATGSFWRRQVVTVKATKVGYRLKQSSGFKATVGSDSIRLVLLRDLVPPLPVDAGTGFGHRMNKQTKTISKDCKVDALAKPNLWDGKRCERPITRSTQKDTDDYKRRFPQLKDCTNVILFTCP
jgi:hypothetical protein